MQESASLLTMAILVGVERARNHGQDAKLAGKIVLLENSDRLNSATIALFPRFLITDHGSQFRESFADLVHALNIGIDVIRGPVQRPQFNGKIERFFRSIKL